MAMIMLGADQNLSVVRRALTRCVVVGVLAIAAVGLASVSALADGFVEICPPGDVGCLAPNLQPMGLSALGPPDVTNGSYRVTMPDGTQQTVTVDDGYSLASVLGEFGDSSPFGFAEVIAPSLYSYLVPSDQAASTAPNPPVVWFDGTSVHFADAAGDYVTQPNTIVINLHAGSLLTVKASTSAHGSIEANAPVHFSVTSVSPQVEGLSYKWYFGDGDASTKASVTYAYPESGVWDAFLRVTGVGDSLGFSKVLQVSVNPAKSNKQRPGAGHKLSGSPTGASSKGNGNKGTKGAGGNGTGTSGTAAGTSTSTSTTQTAKPAPGPKRSPPRPKPSPAGRAPRSRQLVAGVPITGSPPAAGSAATGGVPHPARSGHLVHRHRPGLGWGLWVALGTLATFTLGALLQAYGPPGFMRLPGLPPRRVRAKA